MHNLYFLLFFQKTYFKLSQNEASSIFGSV